MPLWETFEHQTTYQESREVSKHLASPEMFQWCPQESCTQELKPSLRKTHHRIKRSYFVGSNCGFQSMFQKGRQERNAMLSWACITSRRSDQADPNGGSNSGWFWTLRTEFSQFSGEQGQASGPPLPGGTGGMSFSLSPSSAWHVKEHPCSSAKGSAPSLPG